MYEQINFTTVAKYICLYISYAEDQLISEWLFDVLNFPKKTMQKFDEFLP